MANETATLQVRSLAFKHGGHIPEQYTCNGKGTNPPLSILQYPAETKTLALIVEDPDAPSGTFTHWVAWNISPNEPIAEDSVPGDTGFNSGSKEGYYLPAVRYASLLFQGICAGCKTGFTKKHYHQRAIAAGNAGPRDS